jgi:hypothetical protein
VKSATETDEYRGKDAPLRHPGGEVGLRWLTIERHEGATSSTQHYRVPTSVGKPVYQSSLRHRVGAGFLPQLEGGRGFFESNKVSHRNWHYARADQASKGSVKMRSGVKRS